LNGLASIVRIPPPYTEWTRLVTLPYGQIAYDLDVSPDGTLIAATFGDPTGQQTVKVIPVASLDKEDATPAYAFDFGSAVPDNFVFSPDGRYLYGSSYYTGASNLFRYELATKTIEAVTNAETGFLRPIPLGNDELIAFRYTGAGFVPVRLTATPIKDINPITFFGRRRSRNTRSCGAGRPGSPARCRTRTCRRRARTTASPAGSSSSRSSDRPGLQGHAGLRRAAAVLGSAAGSIACSCRLRTRPGATSQAASGAPARRLPALRLAAQGGVERRRLLRSVRSRRK
jgi:hypothetical protein